jgi:alcohol dehydrogenase, propanol-preferring
MAGFSLDGYFQEYATVDARNMMKLPEGLSPDDAAPLFCAGVTAYNSINDLKLDAGKWVAIIGCGGLGHLGELQPRTVMKLPETWLMIN